MAASLKANKCYICSDVDGVYTTDPNTISNAKKNKHLSYTEMLDIAEEGAKVLHNRCIEIAEKFDLPIVTKSTFNNEQGSVIDNKIEENSIKSIVKNDDILLITLKSDTYQAKNTEVFNSGFEIQNLGFIYNSLFTNKIFPIQINSRGDIESGNTEIEFLIKTVDVKRIQKLLDTKFEMYQSSIKPVSRISIIGYGINADESVINKIISTINEFECEIASINVTNTKMSITFKEKVDNQLLECIHNKLF